MSDKGLFACVVLEFPYTESGIKIFRHLVYAAESQAQLQAFTA